MAKTRKTGRNPLGPLYPARRTARLTEQWQGWQQTHPDEEARGFTRDAVGTPRQTREHHGERPPKSKVGDGRSD